MRGRHKKKHRTFGVSLKEAILNNKHSTGINKYVPCIVTDVIDYLEKHDLLTQQGLYRQSGAHNRLEALKESYDKGKPIVLEAKMEDPFTCADLLLTYLRSLPESLFAQINGGLETAIEADDASGHRTAQLRGLIWKLPVENRAVLFAIFQHATKVVQEEDENKMGLKNVVIVFTPSMYCNPKVFAMLLLAYADIFTPECSGCNNRVRPVDLQAHVTDKQAYCGSCNPKKSDDVTQPDPVVANLAVQSAKRTSRFSIKNSPMLSRSRSGSKKSQDMSPPAANRPPPAATPPTSPPTLTTPAAAARASAGALFGVPLIKVCKTAPDSDSIVLPSLVRQCWKHVEAHAKSPVYVTSGDSDLVAKIRMGFDEGRRVNIRRELDDVPGGEHVAATLFQQYVKCLPDSVLTRALLPKFETSRDSVFQLSALAYQLPVERRVFLLHFVAHLRAITKDYDDDVGTKLRALLTSFAGCFGMSPRLMFNIFSNRRTILQPMCSTCGELCALTSSPLFSEPTITCTNCQ